jgi:hypothetical protein
MQCFECTVYSILCTEGLYSIHSMRLIMFIVNCGTFTVHFNVQVYTYIIVMNIVRNQTAQPDSDQTRPETKLDQIRAEISLDQPSPEIRPAIQTSGPGLKTRTPNQTSLPRQIKSASRFRPTDHQHQQTRPAH